MAGGSIAGHMGRIGEIEWKCRAGSLPVNKWNNRGKKSPGWPSHERFHSSLLRQRRCQFSSLELSLHHPPSHPCCDTEQWDAVRLLPPASSLLLLSSLRKRLIGKMGAGGIFITLGWALWLLAASRFCSLSKDGWRKGNYSLRSPGSSLISRGRDKGQI